MERPDAVSVTRVHPADLQPSTRILVRLKRTGLHTDIDYRLLHIKYERIVLWQINESRMFFVAAPDYELCTELYEWWSEIWTLENGSFPRSSHNFGLDTVHNFPAPIRTNELAELIDARRLHAQTWCLKHEHKWCNIKVTGIDYHGQPISFILGSAITCMLNQVPWSTSPYEELITRLITEAERVREQQQQERACTLRLICNNLEQAARRLVTCYTHEQPQSTPHIDYHNSEPGINC